MANDLSAEQFIERLQALRSPEPLEDMNADEGQYGKGDVFIGVRPGQIFTLGKEFTDMPLNDIETLLQSPIHEVRAGALSIMGHQAMRKKIPESRKKELFDLYLKHMDRINSWPLVDISCHKVIGGYLLDKPRDVLYEMSRSQNWCERRAAVYSTLLFMRSGDLDDAFKISEILLYDDEHFIHTAVGGILREAGKQDQARLLSILDQYAATMPRVTLRYAIEHLDKDQRHHYMNMKKAT
jgi:3-methyladenine DNA glycosylase AlkD